MGDSGSVVGDGAQIRHAGQHKPVPLPLPLETGQCDPPSAPSPHHLGSAHPTDGPDGRTQRKRAGLASGTLLRHSSHQSNSNLSLTSGQCSTAPAD